jgi:ABC-type uncharacterized transport system auxiliary subunit
MRSLRQQIRQTAGTPLGCCRSGAVLVLVLLAVSGCRSPSAATPTYPDTAPLNVMYPDGKNRARLRIPGASTEFPETSTHYAAKKKAPYRLVVMLPSDDRARHYGRPVASTRWRGDKTDALWGEDAPRLIRRRLVKEFAVSGLYAEVSDGPVRPGDLTLECEIHAFCAQAHGFLFVRVAGISALHVKLKQEGKTLLSRKFEKVITDADKEYSGSQVTFLEQAMRSTMADSLHELIGDILEEIENKSLPHASELNLTRQP